MQGYTAELAVSAIISSWCRGDAEQNQQPVAFTHENHCRNSSWKQVEQHNCDGIRNPLHRLDFFTPSLAINRLVAHFLFWEAARLRRHEGEHENRARFCNFSSTRITTLALCKFERVGEEWQAATGGCIAASPPFAF